MSENRIHRAVSHDGTEIAYFTNGEGPPLVLVHGGLSDHTRWDALRPYLEPHVTVYAMDRRGRGASGDHPDYAIEREYEDVAAVIDAVAETSASTVAVYGRRNWEAPERFASDLVAFLEELDLPADAKPLWR